MRPRLVAWLLLPSAALALEPAGRAAADEHVGARDLPPVAFEFKKVFRASDGREVISSAVTSETIANECTCQLGCMADPACFGYAHHGDLGKCQRLGQIPSQKTTDSSTAGKNIFRRRGYSRPGEPCSAAEDCHLFEANSTCANGFCTCGGGLQLTPDGLCARAGLTSVPVGKGRLSSSGQLAGPDKADSFIECETRCKVLSTCAGFEYDQQQQGCQLFSAEVEVAEVDNGEADSFLLYQVGDKIMEAPDSFSEVKGLFYRRNGMTLFMDHIQECFADDAIVYPGKDRETTRLLTDTGSFGTDQWWVSGVDALATHDQWICTDGTPLSADDPVWQGSEPNGAEEHMTLVNTENQGMYDIKDDNPYYPTASVCQYVGKNLAPAPKSGAPTVPPGEGVLVSFDGTQNTYTTQSTGSAEHATWTVDLGGFYAVTSVLLILEEDKGEDITVIVANTASPSDAPEEICTVVLTQYQYPGIGRQYSCEEPLIGRFVRLQRFQAPLTVGQLKVMGSTMVRVGSAE